MPYTKAQLRAWVLENADASPSSGFDTAPGGIVDRKIGRVHDRLWADVLNVARFTRGRLVSVITGADGLVATSALSDLTTPNAQRRLYRILDVAVEGWPYEEVTDDLVPYARLWAEGGNGTLGGGLAAGARTWWVFGGSLYTLPIQAGSVLGCWVNDRPTRFDQLTTEDAAVEFPDGYEDILAVHGAAEVIMKGARETEAAIELKASVQDDLNRMLQTLSRASTNPTRVRYVDRAGDWGG